jgi:hypothetical protein
VFSRALNDLSSSLYRCRDNRGGQRREQGHGDGSTAGPPPLALSPELKWWCGFGVGVVSSVLNFPKFCCR